MEITEIKVFPIEEEKLKAFVSIVFDHCFMVNDIKVIRGKDGFFISMPSRRKRNGKFKDVAHPLNNETRQMLEGQILSEYEQVIAGRRDEGEAAPRESREAATAEQQQSQQKSESPALEPSEARTEMNEEPEEGKSLDEVTEMHLRDSFWTT
jgi:stage V sporulation protein G